MLTASLLIRAGALAVLLWLAIVDVQVRRLPTRAVLVVALLYFIDAALRHTPAHVVLAHAVIAVAVFLLCAVLFSLRMLGGGDAKLAAAIFLWTGFELSFDALTLISVIGTCVGLLSIATRRMNPEQRYAALRGLAMFSARRGVPYGVALALGGATVIVASAVLPYLSTR